MSLRSRKIEFGFALPIFGGAEDSHPRTPLLRKVDDALVRNVISSSEKLGFNSIWVADHMMLGLNKSILECWTTLSAAASMSSKLRLGTIHLYNLFRSPSLVAKMASTLDNISGGRLEFFVDPGHRGIEEECSSYGFQRPDAEDRMIQRFDEALQIMKLMWTKDNVSFDGQFYTLKDVTCNPKPVQKPWPPVWIGTMGGEGWTDNSSSDKALRLVAKHADVWNNTPASVEFCASKLKGLKDECISQRRDYEQIIKSLETQIIIAKSQAGLSSLLKRIRAHNPKGTLYGDKARLKEIYLCGTPEECVERINEYVDLGITRFILWFVDVPSSVGMKLFADRVLPSFA